MEIILRTDRKVCCDLRSWSTQVSGTPDTTPKENGGKCSDKCWDSYGKLVRIKEGWNQYQIRWNQLQQEGWGTDARFEVERLMNINFSAKTSSLPADVWIDDVRFLPLGVAPEAPKATPTAGAAQSSLVEPKGD